MRKAVYFLVAAQLAAALPSFANVDEARHARPPSSQLDAGEAARGPVLLVQFPNDTGERQPVIGEIPGVASVSLLLDRLYRVELDPAASKDDVQASLGAIDPAVSIDADQLIHFDDSRGFVTPAGRSTATYKKPALRSPSARFGATIPNDPEFGDQWYLESTGQYGAIPDLDLNATDAWDITTGPANSIVAIVSTGIDYTHEDLAGSVWVNPHEIPGNNMDDDNNGYVDDIHGVNTPRGSGDPMDENGQGTASAGIIAAHTNNGVGISGISWTSKLLACNFYTRLGNSLIGYTSDVISCFDYVYRLKKKAGANITSVLFAEGFLDYRFPLREAVAALDEVGILFIQAGPISVTEPQIIDVVTEFPLGFDLPNTIGVQALGRANSLKIGNLSFFRGRRSIHTMAFGDYLLTTFPGHDPDFDSSAYYFEGFEQGTTWQADPEWTATTDDAYAGSQSMAMVLDTEDFDESRITSPILDLSDYAGQPLGVSLKIKAPDTWVFQNNNAFSKGRVRVYLGWPGLFNWHRLDGISDESQDWRNVHFAFEPWFWDVIADPSQIQFRIEFDRFEPQPLEMYVDNFALGRTPLTASSNRYVYYSGSIPAAAIVAGAAELVKAANPGATAGEIKNAIMSTGFPPNQFDPTGIEDGTSLNNTAVRLWDAGGNGAVNCSGMGFTRRTWPKIHYYEIAATEQDRLLRAVSTDCGQPGAAPLMQPDDGGSAVVLADDGVAPDKYAGDGDFSGYWSKDDPGTTALSLAGDTDLTIVTLDPYDNVQEIPYEWADMSGSSITTIIDEPPFPLLIGNHPTGLADSYQLWPYTGIMRLGHIGQSFTNSSATSAAEVVFFNNRGSLSQFAIPAGVDSLIISVLGAPGLDAPLTQTGQLRDVVLGSAPDRKWVIEFIDLTFRDCPAEQNLNAQLVFFENSSDIQMNFEQFDDICGDPTRLPTVGIQYNEHAFLKYEGAISDHTSLLFTTSGTGGNSPPVASTDTIPAIVRHGTQTVVDLAPYFTDPDGDPLSYSLAARVPGLSINGNLLTAELDYTETGLGFVEDYVYASDGQFAAKANLRVKFEDVGNFPPRPVGPLPVPTFYRNESAHFPLADLIFDPEGDEITWVLGSAPFGFAIWQNGDLLGAGNTTLPDGINEISFKVTDGRSTNTIKMNVNIQPDRANLPPEVITPIGNVDAEVGKMFRVPLYQHFRDPNGDTVLYSFFVAPTPVPVQFDNSPNMVGGVPDASWLAGSPHTISLRVRDPSGAFIVHDFTITVTDPQAMPATAVTPAPTDVPVDEITVSASSEKKSGGGSTDVWLLAALLFLTLVAIRRRSFVLGVEITIAQQRLPADHRY